MEGGIVICSQSRFFLKLSLIWPSNGEEFEPSTFFYIRQFIMFAALILTLIPFVIMHLIKSQENQAEISEDLAVITSLSGMTSMMILYAVQQKKLSQLLTEFRTSPNFVAINKKLDTFTKTLGWYAFIAGICYNLKKITEIRICKNLSFHGEVCGVMIPIWLPFDLGVCLPLYIIYVHFLGMTVGRVYLMISCQILEIAINFKLKIQELNEKLLVSLSGNLETSRNNLHFCIKSHIDIIKSCKNFNDCFTSGMMVYLATVGIICGCVENQIAKQFNPLPILHLLGWISALFVSCLGGQILTDSSLTIQHFAYSSQWYLADVSLRRDLQFLIMRSQKPLFLTTGPFNVLNFTLFLTIMKMSYSILTILK